MEANRRDRSIGDLLKHSFTLAGKNAWGITQLLVLMYIIQVLIIIGISRLGAYYLQKGVNMASIVVVIGSVCIAFLIQSLSTGAILKLVAEKQKGNKFNLWKCIKYMIRKFPQLLGAMIIMGIISTLTGFIATLIYTFLGYYISTSGIVFSIFFGVLLTILDVILLSFIIPLIVRKDMNFLKAFIIGVKLAFSNGGDVIMKLISFMLLTGFIMGISGLLGLIPYAGYFIALILSEVALIIFEIGQLVIVEDYNI